jgi:hypothetical protein
MLGSHPAAVKAGAKTAGATIGHDSLRRKK